MLKSTLIIKMCFALALFLPVLSPGNGSFLFSQTDECIGKLAQAEEEYQAGNFSEAVDLIKPCLKSNELSEAEKGRAYRLLGLVYIAEELEKDANEAVKNLLIMVPRYQVDTERDPPQLKRIIDNVSQALIPEIHSITPDNVNSGEQYVKIKVSGKNFVYGSVVRFNNQDKKTSYISTNALEAELTSNDLSRGGEFYVTVFSPILDGKSSNSVLFKIKSKRLKFAINGILPVPVGDLAATGGNDGDGYASVGFGASAELNYPLSSSGLGWVSSAALLYNGNNSDINENYLKLFGESLGLLNYDVTKEVGSYIAVPIMTGLSYTGEISPALNYIFTGQISFSFISLGIETDKISGTTIDGDVLTGEVKDEYKSATALGFGLGGGIIINDLIIISAKYLTMGKADLKYDETITVTYLGETASENYSDTKKQSFSYFTVSIGIML